MHHSNALNTILSSDAVQVTLRLRVKKLVLNKLIALYKVKSLNGGFINTLSKGKYARKKAFFQKISSMR